jgi:hypothetical protein
MYYGLPWWPSSAGDLRVQLGEVALSDRSPEVVVTRYAAEVVAHTLHVVPVMI